MITVHDILRKTSSIDRHFAYNEAIQHVNLIHHLFTATCILMYITLFILVIAYCYMYTKKIKIIKGLFISSVLTGLMSILTFITAVFLSYTFITYSYKIQTYHINQHVINEYELITSNSNKSEYVYMIHNNIKSNKTVTSNKRLSLNDDKLFAQ